VIYQYVGGPKTWPVEAQVVGEEVDRIREEYGNAKASTIVHSATSKRSLIHDCFEWNNKAAAHEHRKEQARSLVRCVVTVLEEENGNVPVRAFVAVNVGEGERDYMPIRTVLRDPIARARLLEEALVELCRLQEKYAHLCELAEIFRALDRLIRTRRGH